MRNEEGRDRTWGPPRTRKTIEKTSKQKIELTSVFPTVMARISETGLRDEKRLRPPTEMVMRKMKESLQGKKGEMG